MTVDVIDNSLGTSFLDVSYSMNCRRRKWSISPLVDLTQCGRCVSTKLLRVAKNNFPRRYIEMYLVSYDLVPSVRVFDSEGGSSNHVEIYRFPVLHKTSFKSVFKRVPLM